jgi:hypothetical protein
MANGSSGSSNATLILILGILSIVICAPLGIAAWIMGNNALAEIDRGEGDLSQRGTISAGRICGMIGVAIWVIGCLVWIVALGGLAMFGLAGSTTTGP